ncbi:hypothetical protein PIROE2DRAFT_4671 [Piromyces sp. E2]|nr:hypothetical protein PIROE2DRAFT_4671 [Piromyces sp. E2]|eukprot:OUM67731.1 hypothetical protein PIROE2DRAFT_4671 [Piromyces sp. E2]
MNNLNSCFYISDYPNEPIVYVFHDYKNNCKWYFDKNDNNSDFKYSINYRNAFFQLLKNKIELVKYNAIMKYIKPEWIFNEYIDKIVSDSGSNNKILMGDCNEIAIFEMSQS